MEKPKKMPPWPCVADVCSAFMKEVSCVFICFLYFFTIEICLHRIVIIQYTFLENQVSFLILLSTSIIGWVINRSKRVWKSKDVNFNLPVDLTKTVSLKLAQALEKK